MIGIELDNPVGKNNGTVKGVSYFECEPKKGLLIRAVRAACSSCVGENDVATRN